MTTTLSKRTWVEKLIEPIEKRYGILENVCIGAISNLYRSSPAAFAVFAKNIPWWKIPFSQAFRKQMLREAGVYEITYKEWEQAYIALPQEVREQAEAKLPF